MSRDYSHGGLRVPNIGLMSKPLKLAWITRLLREQEPWEQAWKTIPNHFLNKYGGLNFLLKCNYNEKFLRQTNLPHEFFLELKVASRMAFRMRMRCWCGGNVQGVCPSFILALLISVFFAIFHMEAPENTQGVDKTWAWAHGLAHGLPYGLPYELPYFDDFIISQQFCQHDFLKLFVLLFVLYSYQCKMFGKTAT